MRTGTDGLSQTALRVDVKVALNPDRSIQKSAFATIRKLKPARSHPLHTLYMIALMRSHKIGLEVEAEEYTLHPLRRELRG